MELNAKQAAFVREYLVDLNATQAAIRAGYSPKAAKVQGCRLLTHDNIAAAVAEGQAARADRVQVTADQVLAELARIGFANMADYMKATKEGDPYLDFSDLTRDQTAALQEVTVEDYTEGRGEDAREIKRVRFKLADKRAALVDMGKHLGMFKDKIEHTGADGAPLLPAAVTVKIIDPT